MKTVCKGCGWIFLLISAAALIGNIDEHTKDALKVGHILRTIERQTSRSEDATRSAEVTEKELNAYIAYRLKQEEKPMISSLRVNLLDNNHVHGNVGFDAKVLTLDTLLGKKLDFGFEGIFHTREGSARLDLVSLTLNGQNVEPQVLDLVLHTAALMYKENWGTTKDWYELPKGIKRIVVDREKATLYY